MAENKDDKIFGSMDLLISSLLAHAEEENCQHSISDFLEQYFDIKHKRPEARQSPNQDDTTTKVPDERRSLH